MNRTKIEWTIWTWNVITGCLRGCWYCYGRKMAKRGFIKNDFKPLFYPGRLFEPYKLKKPSKIFVCSISDLFAEWTPKKWRDLVLASIFLCPVKHVFQLLTKSPERIPDITFPNNVWVGATVTTENIDEVNIDHIKKVKARIRFISFEPLLGPVDFDRYDLKGIQWVIIGKLTGHKREFKIEWVDKIVEHCWARKIPVFLKNNLGIKDARQEFPT